MGGIVIQIGMRVTIKTAVDIRVRGEAPGYNGIRTIGDGKDEAVRAPRRIKIGTITELVHRIPTLELPRRLKMVAWLIQEKTAKVGRSWWVLDGVRRRRVTPWVRWTV